jgi:hypothetical protein
MVAERLDVGNPVGMVGLPQSFAPGVTCLRVRGRGRDDLHQSVDGRVDGRPDRARGAADIAERATRRRRIDAVALGAHRHVTFDFFANVVRCRTASKPALQTHPRTLQILVRNSNSMPKSFIP